jgi:hypothetical protein
MERFLQRLLKWRISWPFVGFLLQFFFPTLGERAMKAVFAAVLSVGSVLYAAVLPPYVLLRSEDAVRYQIAASRYNPAHAALTMDLVAVPTLTGLPEATPVSSTCSPPLTISCRPH